MTLEALFGALEDEEAEVPRDPELSRAAARLYEVVDARLDEADDMPPTALLEVVPLRSRAAR